MNNKIISKGRIILAAVLSTVLALSVPAMKMEVKADNSPSITSASFDEKTAKVKFVLDGDGCDPEVIFLINTDEPYAQVISNFQFEKGVEKEIYEGDKLTQTMGYHWFVVYYASADAKSYVNSQRGQNGYNFNYVYNDAGDIHDFFQAMTSAGKLAYSEGSGTYTQSVTKMAAPTNLRWYERTTNRVEVLWGFDPVADALGYYIYETCYYSGDANPHHSTSTAWVDDETSTDCFGTEFENNDKLIKMEIEVVTISSDKTKYEDSDRSAMLTINRNDLKLNGSSSSGSSSTNNSSSENNTSSSSTSDTSSSNSSSSDSSSSGSSSSDSSTPPALQTPAVSGSAGGQSIKSWNDLNGALKSNNNNSSPVEVTVNNGKIPDSVTKTLATSKTPLHVLTGNGVGITINGGSAAPKGDLNVKSTVTSTNNSKTIAFESNKILPSPIAIHTTVPAGTKSVNLYIKLAGQKIKISPKPLEPTADGRLVFPVILLGTYELDY